MSQSNWYYWFEPQNSRRNSKKSRSHQVARQKDLSLRMATIIV
jgi:hypothetical protein